MTCFSDLNFLVKTSLRKVRSETPLGPKTETMNNAAYSLAKPKTCFAISTSKEEKAHSHDNRQLLRQGSFFLNDNLAIKIHCLGREYI